MHTETPTKPSTATNRAIQRTHATYKRKAEISEALHLIRPYLNESTYKWLSHFLHTDGTGVTQAKNITICEKVGIAERTYYSTVKPELETVFSQPLIITTPAPMKYDKARKKRVKASPFKSLMPLSVVKHLVKQKQAEENEYWEQHYSSNAVEYAVEYAVESNAEIPCESKDESTFEQQQNKSFRENHLEKPLKDYKDNRLRETDFVFSHPKKYAIKKEIKDILHQDILNALDNEQRQEFANRAQIALKKTGADIKDPNIQNAVFEGCYGFVIQYEKDPSNLNDLEKYYGALYVCIENAIFECLIAQEQEELDEQDEDEFDCFEDYGHEGAHGYNGEYYSDNMRREAFKEAYYATKAELVATKEELDEMGIY